MKIFWLGITVLWTLFLLGILLAPGNDLKTPNFLEFRYFDKVVHFGLFFVTETLYVSMVWFIPRFSTRIKLSILVGVVLAAGTEFAQFFIPYRDMDIYDFLADITGLFLGIAAVLIFRRISEKNTFHHKLRNLFT
jgi:VanZ family protein